MGYCAKRRSSPPMARHHGIDFGFFETPAGVIQPTGAKIDIPCADFFYMRNGKIERFDCYPAVSIMLKQMGVLPDFASAVKRSTQR